MTTAIVGVVKERRPGERRVALVPADVARLADKGVRVLVETGAGDAAWYSDEAYRSAGAVVTDGAGVVSKAGIIVMVGHPEEADLDELRPGTMLMGMLHPRTEPRLVGRLAAAGVTAVSLDLMPRTLPRAQSMDVLSSQAAVAGYKAVLTAADVYGRFLPMMVTPAGTARPAKVLVLGLGVAGLQAVGTARRLGAVVVAYDLRPGTAEEAASLGATFLRLAGTPVDTATADGYARPLSEDEQRGQRDALQAVIPDQDIVITTAQVPGRRPPLLVTEAAVAAMRPGSVIVDLAAGSPGGNVEVSIPGATLVTDNGVTVIGAHDLPSAMPAASSAAHSRNVIALLAHLAPDGEPRVDLTDEITAAIVVAHGGHIVHGEFARSTECHLAGGVPSGR